MLGAADSTWAYVAPMALIWLMYASLRTAGSRRNRRIRDRAIAAGLTEPATLHPVIDPLRCIGCGACVRACPEEEVLGLIDGKADLIGPTRCIGHGACKTACPVQAISLVFGTATRGVDIPVVDPNFETDVPGVYIAGELGGMGLIRNAVEQGRQAIESIARREAGSADDRLDVLVVGAGPAGFSASLAAMERKLRCVTLEQDTLGGTVAHYPRGKIVMTAPVELPMVGRVRFGETTKEKLLDFWRRVESETKVRIHYEERVESLAAEPGGFAVTSNRNTYRTRAVLLAIGRRGTPRKLGVPGEERDKVVYRLVDPAQYDGKHVLVVGGGDSAIEAAVSIAAEAGTQVTLCYRGDAFGRAKAENRERLEQATAQGRLLAWLRTEVAEIGDATVRVNRDGELVDIDNDAVIVCAGGVLPTALLQGIGVTVQTKHGTA